VSEPVDRLPGPNARNPTGALVVAFVHGWKHSADSADTNVCCFREIIKRLAEREARITPAGPRKVIGVYFSWPAGQSTLGFWRIKDRADFVGYGHIAADRFAGVVCNLDAAHGTRPAFLGTRNQAAEFCHRARRRHPIQFTLLIEVVDLLEGAAMLKSALLSSVLSPFTPFWPGGRCYEFSFPASRRDGAGCERLCV
jgi:hypothetical protein